MSAPTSRVASRSRRLDTRRRPSRRMSVLAPSRVRAGRRRCGYHRGGHVRRPHAPESVANRASRSVVVRIDALVGVVVRKPRLRPWEATRVSARSRRGPGRLVGRSDQFGEPVGPLSLVRARCRARGLRRSARRRERDAASRARRARARRAARSPSPRRGGDPAVDSPATAALLLLKRSSHGHRVTDIGVEEPRSAGSRRPTQTYLRCRTGISSATPQALSSAVSKAASPPGSSGPAASLKFESATAGPGAGLPSRPRIGGKSAARPRYSWQTQSRAR